MGSLGDEPKQNKEYEDMADNSHGTNNELNVNYLDGKI